MITNTVRDLEVFYDAAHERFVPLRSGRAITEVFFFGGRRGSGKTYAAGKFVEQLLDCGLPVIVIDVVGNWWGLRVSAHRAGDGFPIPVIGGDHGDIDVLAEGGVAVAQMLVETGTSAVLDLSRLRKGARQRFLTEWAEEFFHLKKSDQYPVHVVIEEAHTLIPQRAMKGQERMLGALEDLVRLGRNYGIGISMLDQRPQSVHKDVLNQAEVLCAFQFTGAQERDAIRRWAEAKELDGVKNAFSELASLPRGQCILWSPEWLKFCGKVEIAPKVTLDASATPDGSTATGAKKMRAIDLGALKAAMEKAAGAKSKAAASPAVQRRVTRAAEDAALDAMNAPRHDPAEVLKERNELLDETLSAHEQLAVLEKEVAALRKIEKTLRSELAVARDDLRIVRDKWARALSQVNVAKTAHEALLTILQIGELQVLGSTEVIDAHPANGARAVHPEWAGKKPPDVDAILRSAAEPKDWRRHTTSNLMPPAQPPPTRNSEIAKFMSGTPDPEANEMVRAFLTVLYQRGPLNQSQVMMYANYVKNGHTNKAFALMKAKEWVLLGNFGDGSSVQMAITGKGAAALGAPVEITPPALNQMERAFLIVYAQRGAVTQRQVLTHTHYVKNGHTNKAFARLRARGLVDDGGITAWGREVLGNFDKISVGKAFAQDLIAGRVGKLNQMERSFLAVLWNKGSEGLSQAQVLKDAQYVKNGHTNKAFKNLRQMGYCCSSPNGIACSIDLYDE